MRIFKSLLLSLLLVHTAQAQTPAEHNPQPFPAWVGDFKTEAMGQGIPQTLLDQGFMGIAPDAKIIELDRAQPEGRMTLQQYLDRIVTKDRLQRANTHYRNNKTLLHRIGRQYGVNPRMIVALWGIETDFGVVTGGFNVIEALATLAYDGRRSAYFRGELLNAFKVLQQGHIPLSRFTGSWAGAMGQCQFMPSSFLKFAVDANGDKHKDIWQSREDVFASIANYLHMSGWDEKYTWGREVRLPTNIDRSLFSADIYKPLAQWQQLGIRTIDGKNLPAVNIPASLIVPDREQVDISNPRAFLAYNNFQVLLKWNRSSLFALGALGIAEGINP